MSEPTGKFSIRYTNGQWELKAPSGEKLDCGAIMISADWKNPSPTVTMTMTLPDCEIDIEVDPENVTRKAPS